MTSVFQPRGYQKDAIDAIAEANARGVSRPLVCHPTGLGKTILASLLIREVSGRSLFLAHRDELIHQTVDKIGLVAPKRRVGVVKAARNDHDAEVVVASVATLARASRRSQLGGFDLIVVDEAHHAGARSWRAMLEHFGSFIPQGGPLTVGLTATPVRTNGGLGAIWEEVVHQIDLVDAIFEGYLSDLRVQVVGTDMDLEHVAVRKGDLDEKSLGAEMERTGALKTIADAIVTHAADRKTIAFLPTVATAYELADELCARGVAAEGFDGSTPPDERRAIIARLRSGATQVLCNCAVLTEGFDEPSVDCVVMARPTRSQALYLQCLGRGLRRHPGKEDCLVLDVVDVAAMHDLVCVADLAPGSSRDLDGATLSEAAARSRETTGTGREVQIQLAGRSRAEVAVKKGLRWLPVEAGFVLPAGGPDVLLVPRDADRWDVVETRHGRAGDTLAATLTLEDAQGIGETVARDRALTLAKSNARWLTRPPTPEQLSLLRGFGLRDTSVIATRGQASDLITRVYARKALRSLTGVAA